MESDQDSTRCLKLSSNEYKLFPTVESLTSNVHVFVCPLTTCQKQLGSAAALNKHLQLCIRQYRASAHCEDARFILQYHCPISGCIYSNTLGRYFTCLKYLKQHYEKVHAMRNLKCDKCSEAFSRQYYLDAHRRHCGEEFKCTCGLKYASREALLTHAKRHQHVLGETNISRKRKEAVKPLENLLIHNSKPVTKLMQPTVDNISTKRSQTLSKPRLLLPKAAPLSSIPLPTLAALALSELSGVRDSTKQVDVSTQVNFKTSSGHCYACHNDNTRISKNLRKFLSHSKFLGPSFKRAASGICNYDLTHQENDYLKYQRCSAETQTKTSSLKTCAETQTSECQVVDSTLLNYYTLGSVKMRNYAGTKQSIQTQTGMNMSSGPLENYYPQQHFLHNFELDKNDALDGHYSESRQSSTLTSTQNQISTHAQTYNLTTNSSGTQTPDMLHRQCSSSQTEKDVFLGHMANAFNLEKTCLSVQGSHLGAFSHSNTIAPQNSDGATDIEYNALFSPEPCGCDKINQIRVYSIETQTELNLDCLFMCGNEEVESRPDDIMCFNIETQTSDDLQGLQYEQLLSNTQTQTTEEYLFPELNFTDIQTQTGSIGTIAQSTNQLHELVHIQTQTHATRSNSHFTSNETQTFSQLELCAELIDSHTQTTWSCLQELVSGL